MLKTLALALLATAALVPVAEAKTVITCLTNSGHLTRQHQPLVDEFNAMQADIEVRYAAPSKDYSDTHLKLMRASATNTLPDCAFEAYNHFPSLVRAMVKRDQVVNLDTLIADEDDGWKQANYSENMLDLGRVDGVQYGMPFNASVIQWYYNADLFEKAGLDPDNFPKDWDGLFAATQKIKAAEPDVIPMFMWMINGDDWGFQSLIEMQGGKMLSDDGQSVAFNENGHGVEAMKLARRLVTEGGARTDQDSDTQLTAFTSGNLAIWGLSPASARNIEERVGGKFDLRSTTFTVWNDEDGRLPTGGNAAMITTQDPEKIAAAWEYIKFVTGPHGQEVAANITGYLPTNKRTMEPEFLGTFYAENPFYATPVNQYDRAGPWYGYPGTQSEKIWRDQSSVIKSVMEGETSPEDGAQQLQDIAEKLMQR